MSKVKINHKLTSGWINDKPKKRIIKYDLIDSKTLKELRRLLEIFNRKQI